jgi:hypothetical protein
MTDEFKKTVKIGHKFGPGLYGYDYVWPIFLVCPLRDNFEPCFSV